MGGGFAGVRLALALSSHTHMHAEVTLISQNEHFEYYPALYRVATGRSPLHASIRLDEIFQHKKHIHLVYDRIVGGDPTKNILQAESGATYAYDILVLALGSETMYFNIPGLAEHSVGFKSVNQSLQLKNHLHDLFHNHNALRAEDEKNNLRIVVGGGGPSGVELIAELALYTKELAKRHEVDYSHVSLILIEAGERILKQAPERSAKKALVRLEKLGVHVHVNEKIAKQDESAVYTNTMTIPTKTLIWTAGAQVNSLYRTIPGLQYEKNGKVSVDEKMRAKGFSNIYIAGDGAGTVYSGMAQTAIYDGTFIAHAIVHDVKGKQFKKVYSPKMVAHSIPVGKGWGIFDLGKIAFSGWPAWWLRRFIDLDFFLSILPVVRAVEIFFEGNKSCEQCVICKDDEEEN